MEHNPAQPFIWSWKPRNATRFAKYGRHRTENTLFTDFSSVFCGRRANRPHMLVHDGHSSFWSSKHPQLVADSNSSSIHSAMLCQHSRQDTYWGKLQGVCRKDKLEKTLKAVPLQARSEEYWKHSCGWLLFEQLLFVAKHVTLSQKMPLVLLVSIPLALLTSSEVLPCSHGADMSLAMSDFISFFPWEIPAYWNRMFWKQLAGNI